MTPIISLIIPANNEEKYIEQTLQSIADQDYKNYETIVVTNGCTDKTEKIVKDMQQQHPQLNLQQFSLKQANVSRARNHGANKSSGNILFFLDADTRLAQDSLKKVNEKFQQSHALLVPKVKADSKKSRYKLIMGVKNVWNKTGLYKASTGTGTFICNKEMFDKVNGYNPEIIVKEHRHLARKILKHGKYVHVNTKVTTSMRRYESWGVLKSSSFWIKKLLQEKFGNLKDSEYEKIR